MPAREDPRGARSRIPVSGHRVPWGPVLAWGPGGPEPEGPHLQPPAPPPACIRACLLWCLPAAYTLYTGIWLDGPTHNLYKLTVGLTMLMLYTVVSPAGHASGLGMVERGFFRCASPFRWFLRESVLTPVQGRDLPGSYQVFAPWEVFTSGKTSRLYETTWIFGLTMLERAPIWTLTAVEKRARRESRFTPSIVPR
jgi:hypothetical protein